MPEATQPGNEPGPRPERLQRSANDAGPNAGVRPGDAQRGGQSAHQSANDVIVGAGVISELERAREDGTVTASEAQQLRRQLADMPAGERQALYREIVERDANLGLAGRSLADLYTVLSGAPGEPAPTRHLPEHEGSELVAVIAREASREQVRGFAEQRSTGALDALRAETFTERMSEHLREPVRFNLMEARFNRAVPEENALRRTLDRANPLPEMLGAGRADDGPHPLVTDRMIQRPQYHLERLGGEMGPDGSVALPDTRDGGRILAIMDHSPNTGFAGSHGGQLDFEAIRAANAHMSEAFREGYRETANQLAAGKTIAAVEELVTGAFSVAGQRALSRGAVGAFDAPQNPGRTSLADDDAPTIPMRFDPKTGRYKPGVFAEAAGPRSDATATRPSATDSPAYATRVGRGGDDDAPYPVTSERVERPARRTEPSIHGLPSDVPRQEALRHFAVQYPDVHGLMEQRFTVQEQKAVIGFMNNGWDLEAALADVNPDWIAVGDTTHTTISGDQPYAAYLPPDIEERMGAQPGFSRPDSSTHDTLREVFGSARWEVIEFARAHDYDPAALAEATRLAREEGGAMLPRDIRHRLEQTLNAYEEPSASLQARMTREFGESGAAQVLEFAREHEYHPKALTDALAASRERVENVRDTYRALQMYQQLEQKRPTEDFGPEIALKRQELGAAMLEWDGRGLTSDPLPPGMSDEFRLVVGGPHDVTNDPDYSDLRREIEDIVHQARQMDLLPEQYNVTLVTDGFQGRTGDRTRGLADQRGNLLLNVDNLTDRVQGNPAPADTQLPRGRYESAHVQLVAHEIGHQIYAEAAPASDAANPAESRPLGAEERQQMQDLRQVLTDLEVQQQIRMFSPYVSNILEMRRGDLHASLQQRVDATEHARQELAAEFAAAALSGRAVPEDVWERVKPHLHEDFRERIGPHLNLIDVRL